MHICNSVSSSNNHLPCKTKQAKHILSGTPEREKGWRKPSSSSGFGNPLLSPFPSATFYALSAELQTLQEISVWGDQCPGALISSETLGCVNSQENAEFLQKLFFKNSKKGRFFFHENAIKKKERARAGRRRPISPCCLERWHFEGENKMSYISYL